MVAETARNFTAEELLADVTKTLSSVFGPMEWAEDEIERAQKRHPAAADAIYHGFILLVPTHARMSHELAYRAHCRELLDRIADGADTRPGTAAEVCCACSAASLIAPLSSTAAGLYGRMWAAAFPDLPVLTDRQQHHEALERPAIDDLEAMSRKRLTVQGRTLDGIQCGGRHHGDTVRCRYRSAAA